MAQGYGRSLVLGDRHGRRNPRQLAIEGWPHNPNRVRLLDEATCDRQREEAEAARIKAVRAEYEARCQAQANWSPGRRAEEAERRARWEVMHIPAQEPGRVGYRNSINRSHALESNLMTPESIEYLTTPDPTGLSSVDQAATFAMVNSFSPAEVADYLKFSPADKEKIIDGCIKKAVKDAEHWYRVDNPDMHGAVPPQVFCKITKSYGVSPDTVARIAGQCNVLMEGCKALADDDVNREYDEWMRSIQNDQGIVWPPRENEDVMVDEGVADDQRLRREEGVWGEHAPDEEPDPFVDANEPRLFQPVPNDPFYNPRADAPYDSDYDPGYDDICATD